MTNVTSHEVRLGARPAGLPKRSDWRFTQRDAIALGEGEVLVKTLYLSLDPAMRGWMNEGRSYIKPVEIGEVMRAGGVGEVVKAVIRSSSPATSSSAPWACRNTRP
jgi:NADPH-dependent curcumin reductase CurA